MLALRIFVTLWPVLLCTLLPPPAFAQHELLVRPLTERKVDELPAGTLYWRIENYPSVDAARAAAGDWSLVAEAEAKVWLFTLGPAGGASGKGMKVAEVGPIPRITADHYLLRINEASGRRVA